MDKAKIIAVCLLVLAGLILTSCAVPPAQLSERSIEIMKRPSYKPAEILSDRDRALYKIEALYKVEKISLNIIRVVGLVAFPENYDFANDDGSYDRTLDRRHYTFGKSLALGLAKVGETYAIKEVIPIIPLGDSTGVRELIVIVEEYR